MGLICRGLRRLASGLCLGATLWFGPHDSVAVTSPRFSTARERRRACFSIVIGAWIAPEDWFGHHDT